jgi:hypothetical protein
LAQDLVAAWVHAQGVDHLTIEQAEWCLQQVLPKKVDRKAFSATWIGVLTPRRSATYVFSTTPINVNKAIGNDAVRETMSVTLAGNQVLNTNPDQPGAADAKKSERKQLSASSIATAWEWKGQPIPLQAGRAVPIRVDVTYACRRANPTDAPSAMLFWEAPGMDRRSIAGEMLTLPNGSAGGLQAAYSWKEETQPITVTEQDPTLDFAWATPADIAPRAPAVVRQLTDRIWQLATSPAYLGDCTSRNVSHIYFDDASSIEYLTSTQRKEFTQLLVQHPDLLALANKEQLVRIYRSLRFGAEDESLDLLGLWMHRHANIEPEITAEFFHVNRQSFVELADCITRQLPNQYKLLKERYLETSDGRCVLPAAYTLSYSFAMAANSAAAAMPKGPIQATRESKSNRSGNASIATASSPAAPDALSNDWVKLVEAKLNDKSMVGNLRVNWLLARA